MQLSATISAGGQSGLLFAQRPSCISYWRTFLTWVVFRNALMLAAERGCGDSVSLICKREDVDVDAVDLSGQVCLARLDVFVLVSSLFISCRAWRLQSNLLSSCCALTNLPHVPVTMRNSFTVFFAMQSALHIALLHGNLEVLDVLITEKTAKTDLRDNFGRTTVHLAAMAGYDEALRVLLKTAPANTLDNSNHTPMHYACYHGHDDCVAVLLEEEQPWFAQDESLFGSLHCAAARGHGSCIESLLEEQSEADGKHILDVNAIDAFGRAPLHVAAQYDHESCLLVLLQFGAVVDQLDRHGQTALMIACANNFFATAVSLIDQGNVNLQLTNPSGNNILHLAFAATSEPAGACAVLQSTLQKMKENDASEADIAAMVNQVNVSGKR